MMDVKIIKPINGGAVRAVASKSDAHRLLVCSAFADGKTFIGCPETSRDIEATAGCLASLGAAVSRERGGFMVSPVKKNNAERGGRAVLDCGESGSTLRFLLPVCGVLGTDTEFKMGGLLPTRPIAELRDELVRHGYEISCTGTNPLVCRGQMTGGKFVLPGGVSSQYISGLLLALPLTKTGGSIFVEGKIESRPYVDMTLGALKKFGVAVREEGQNFFVPGGGSYRSPKTAAAEGDWSNAAFWLCAGAIGKNPVTCTGLDTSSRQGDREIVEILKRFGAEVEIEKTPDINAENYSESETCDNNFSRGCSVTVRPGTKRLRGIEIDAANIPDLVPVLAAVAAASEGTTLIRGAARLRAKESDRLKTVTASLTALGADIAETEDGLAVNGAGPYAGGRNLRGGCADSFGDHRIAMAAAVASLICEGPVTIKNAEAVKKSYPDFFADFKKLGGEITIR
ncbi:MAG: 3-phosphoshikimate 1-carboxyvinyltransferase [Defluviitaleaceae bacterium]|nr:3-phosphoshikimate 1-carboxyvinyltransferase [Defluviitaleaceae bacterium]